MEAKEEGMPESAQNGKDLVQNVVKDIDLRDNAAESEKKYQYFHSEPVTARALVIYQIVHPFSCLCDDNRSLFEEEEKYNNC